MAKSKFGQDGLEGLHFETAEETTARDEKFIGESEEFLVEPPPTLKEPQEFDREMTSESGSAYVNGWESQERGVPREHYTKVDLAFQNDWLAGWDAAKEAVD